jgi:hypothetical protein
MKKNKNEDRDVGEGTQQFKNIKTKLKELVFTFYFYFIPIMNYFFIIITFRKNIYTEILVTVVVRHINKEILSKKLCI